MEVDDAVVQDVVAGRRPIRKIFTKEQRALFDAHAPDGLGLDDLAVLGPINVLKLKFTPTDFGRRLTAELWDYPDGGRILELSTKCAPAEAFDVASQTRAFLTERGVPKFMWPERVHHLDELPIHDRPCCGCIELPVERDDAAESGGRVGAVRIHIGRGD